MLLSLLVILHVVYRSDTGAETLSVLILLKAWQLALSIGVQVVKLSVLNLCGVVG